MKHSPAPWIETENDDGDIIVRMDESHSVVFGNLEGSCTTCHANARLTAMAPRILEALVRLYSKYAADSLQPIDWYHAAQVLKGFIAEPLPPEEWSKLP